MQGDRKERNTGIYLLGFLHDGDRILRLGWLHRHPRSEDTGVFFERMFLELTTVEDTLGPLPHLCEGKEETGSDESYSPFPRDWLVFENCEMSGRSSDKKGRRR